MIVNEFVNDNRKETVMEKTKRMRNILLGFAIKYNNDYVKIFQAIHKRERLDESDFEKLKRLKVKRLQLSIRTILIFLKCRIIHRSFYS